MRPGETRWDPVRPGQASVSPDCLHTQLKVRWPQRDRKWNFLAEIQAEHSKHGLELLDLGRWALGCYQSSTSTPHLKIAALTQNCNGWKCKNALATQTWGSAVQLAFLQSGPRWQTGGGSVWVWRHPRVLSHQLPARATMDCWTTCVRHKCFASASLKTTLRPSSGLPPFLVWQACGIPYRLGTNRHSRLALKKFMTFDV